MVSKNLGARIRGFTHQILYSLGMILFTLVHHAHAVSAHSVEISPTTTQLQQSRGMQLLALQNIKISPAYSSHLVQQGKELYTLGKFSEAVRVWQQALKNSDDNQLRQAMLWSNISLGYQQLGLWEQAKIAIANSLQILANQSNSANSKEKLQILGQALNTQGSLQFALGQTESALSSWQTATEAFSQIVDNHGKISSLLNQVQALRSLGNYHRMTEILKAIVQDLNKQPDSELKASGLRSLGDRLILIENFTEAKSALNQSLAIASKLNAKAEISATQLSLGNLARTEYDMNTALKFYNAAAGNAANPLSMLQAELNKFSLLIEEKKFTEATALIPQLDTLSDRLIPSRNAMYAKLNLAQNLAILANANSANKQSLLLKSANLLAEILRQAAALDDQRVRTYALGSLGALYEQSQQFQEAQDLTQQALLIAQTINALDIAYRWRWQLGRLRHAQGDISGAIAHYTEAVNHLQQLRYDLASVNSGVEFSFRESIEPVYRQLISLLLTEERANPDKSKNLAKAQGIIESLQLAELVNFLRSNCLTANPVDIVNVDQHAAVIYPIILEDRLEIIISSSQQPLRHYSAKVTQKELEQIISELQIDLREPRTQDYLSKSQTIYDWLIRPAIADLQKSNIKTLVFVLDGSLRNIPMASLHDGKKFLIESYSIALTPGLQLLEPKPLSSEKIAVLAGGITEARNGFTALPNVTQELHNIQTQVPSKQLLNQDFTENNLRKNLLNNPFPVIHLATHGQFSSKASDTFLSTWDGMLNLDSMTQLIKSRDQDKVLELLILSACQTAVGDNRAALGLAGISVRAGARSTIASLWSIDDTATSLFMTEFYKDLAKGKNEKAASLRQAQIALIAQSKYKHPYYWSPFVLLGNWL
jgi:CHAT domain-containing protein